MILLFSFTEKYTNCNHRAFHDFWLKTYGFYENSKNGNGSICTKLISWISLFSEIQLFFSAELCLKNIMCSSFC